MQRLRFNPWIRKIPWRREWLPTPVFLPGESQGRRSLASYSPQCHKESDTTEQLPLYDKDKTKVHTQKCNTSKIYVFDLHCSFSGDIHLYVILSEIQISGFDLSALLIGMNMKLYFQTSQEFSYVLFEVTFSSPGGNLLFCYLLHFHPLFLCFTFYKSTFFFP